MKLTKNQKGITLVALIITIIVLLILAVVSIRAIKDGGILSKTQTAKETYSESEEKEKIQLAINQAAIDGLGTINEDALTKALNDEFKNNWEYSMKSANSFIVRIKSSNREYQIEKNSGAISIPEKLPIARGIYSEENKTFGVTTKIKIVSKNDIIRIVQSPFFPSANIYYADNEENHLEETYVATMSDGTTRTFNNALVNEANEIFGYITEDSKIISLMYSFNTKKMIYYDIQEDGTLTKSEESDLPNNDKIVTESYIDSSNNQLIGFNSQRDKIYEGGYKCGYNGYSTELDCIIVDDFKATMNDGKEIDFSGKKIVFSNTFRNLSVTKSKELKGYIDEETNEFVELDVNRSSTYNDSGITTDGYESITEARRLKLNKK